MLHLTSLVHWCSKKLMMVRRRTKGEPTERDSRFFFGVDLCFPFLFGSFSRRSALGSRIGPNVDYLSASGANVLGFAESEDGRDGLLLSGAI